MAAQGFHDRRPEPFGATMRHVQRVIDRVGIIRALGLAALNIAGSFYAILPLMTLLAAIALGSISL
mgnify:CR=1 FL=1